MISFTRAELVRFVKTSSIGAATFVLDLVLLYALVEYVGVDYRVATAVAFLLCVTLNYALARTLVFATSERSYSSGYGMYVALALLSMAIITTLVWLLVEYMLLPYLYARVLVAGLVGIFNYVMGVTVIFKVKV